MSVRVVASSIAALIAVAVAGCNGGLAPLAGTQPPLGSNSGRSGSSSPIQHVVIVVQENRTFNDFFATYSGADGTTTGQAEADPKCSPPIKNGPIALKEMNLVLPKDLDHSYPDFHTAIDGGKMDGFDRATYDLVKGDPECAYPYQYTNPGQIQPYWDMAQEYTLAEHMFTTQGSDSFTAHQDLIAGSTQVFPGKAMVDLPSCGDCYWGCDAPKGTHTSLITQDDKYMRAQGPFPCTTKFTTKYPTLRDVLDAKSISWKYYLPPPSKIFGKLMSAFDVIAAVRNGPEWKTNIIYPETEIFTDISDGALPAVSWVIPEEPNSDHPGETVDNGPSWVASVVNAIGESSYWNSTAIVIVWDDWGGLYDNLPPNESKRKYGYGGLGLRVPAIVVSPYAKAGYISQTDYEFGSILKYIENNWNLGTLHTSDQRAASLIDCFDYSQTPITFTPIPSSHDKAFFLRQKPSSLPIDDDM